MKPKQSLRALTKRIDATGKSLTDLTVGDGIEAMLAFYTEERADGCKLEEDGDMLLYQWGTYQFSKTEKTFQLGIVRQFILPRQDEPFQLLLTFHFPATATLTKLKSGNHWCSAPDSAEECRTLIHNSAAYRAVAKEKPLKVTLNFEQC